MSDSLFVTLWLLSGWSRDFVEITEYANGDRPLYVEFEGKKFRYLGTPETVSTFLNEDGSFEAEMSKGEPTFVEVKP